MATIPIEVIVQDKASPEPTPTPSDSGETNIVVPDTGVGTVENGSNGGGIGSAVSIILPAIILVLAIGAIVAIMVHRYQKRKKANDGTEECNVKVNKRTVSRKEKLATVASGTIAILAATVLVGNLVIPATKATTNVEPGTAELDTVDKITITATREIDSDIVVATVKNTSYATANLDFGYKVTASMAENATTANLYLNGDETSEYYIAPVENEDEGDENIENENTAGNAELTKNTWGYTLEEPSEGTTYLSIPLVDTPATITKGNDMVEDEAVDIYYTIKVDKDLPAGRYIGELEYTLTDNNFPSTLTTMQGMTTEICENTYTPGNQVTDPVPTATLEDIRDHKTYTIAKLADGKCWMTQNLDLDLSTEVTLTPADTDVSANWTPDNSTIHFAGTTVDGWQDDDYTPYSADPGDVYYYTSGTDADDIKYDSLEECEAKHSDGTCQHYHAGNYYSWSAAVASNDTFELIGDGSTASSICPAGWRLPVNEGLGADDVNEQKKVITAYDEIVGEWAGKPWERYYNYQNGGFNSLRRNPIWLVRAGMISFISGSLSSSGISGYYWSSSYSASGHMANGGNFNSNYIQPDAGNGWPAGYSVRCIAQ